MAKAILAFLGLQEKQAKGSLNFFYLKVYELFFI